LLVNAQVPIMVTELPIVTEVRRLPWNAPLPMYRTESGMITEVSLLPWNAPGPISVTG